MQENISNTKLSEFSLQKQDNVTQKKKRIANCQN